MQEELISFETAKLAKEKGFDLDCLYHYNPDYKEVLENSVRNKKIVATHHLYANNYDFEIDRWGGGTQNSFVAPTQSLLQKWLREEHKIYIEICHSYRDLTHYTYHVYTNWEEYSSKMMKAFNNELKHFLTYEEALEEGLQEALKLLKN